MDSVTFWEMVSSLSVTTNTRKHVSLSVQSLLLAHDTGSQGPSRVCPLPNARQGAWGTAGICELIELSRLC